MIKLTRELENWINNNYSQFYLQRDNDYKLFAMNKVQKSHFDNSTKLLLIQAIIDDEWEVEEEPLYYVRNNIGAALLKKENGKVVTSMPHARFFTDNKEEFQLTKREVASYDKRYLEFLEEVE